MRTKLRRLQAAMLIAGLLVVVGPVARGQTAAQWLEQGSAAARAGRFDEAISAYSKVIALEPKSVAALTGRAKAREGTQDIAGALEDYRRALAAAPGDAAITQSIDRLAQKGGGAAPSQPPPLPPPPSMPGPPPLPPAGGAVPTTTPKTAATTGADAKAAPAPLRLGSGVERPRLITHVEPVYPPIAASARIQGVVIVEATIQPDGTVTDAVIVRGIPLLDQAAIDAVRQWVYAPPAQKVPVIVTVTVTFSMKMK